MVARRTFFAALLTGVVFTPWALSAQLPSSTPYAHVLDLYRAGQIDTALKELVTLTPDQIESDRAALLRGFDKGKLDSSVRAAASMRLAAMVHTEAAMALRERDIIGWKRHVGIARAYVEKLARLRDQQVPLPRMWWVLMMTYLQGQFDLSAAAELGDRAHDTVGDSPELFLAIGATQEMGWTWHHEADVAAPFKGDLKDAERAYRNSLAAQPDFLEARLRLGRVLTLRGDMDGALKSLGEIGDRTEPAFRYLARLFEGDAFERRGDLAEAERRYLVATAALPAAQSAHVALAHVRHAIGARTEAAENVRVTAGATSTPNTEDPWFWYSRGLSWRTPGYLRALRAMVQQ